MDHDVELDSGVVAHNPMRVIPNDNGSEPIFALLLQLDISNEQFAEDKQVIEKNLATLKYNICGLFLNGSFYLIIKDS